MRFHNLHRTCRRPQIPSGSPWRYRVTWQLSWPWTSPHWTGGKVKICLNRTMVAVRSCHHSLHSMWDTIISNKLYNHVRVPGVESVASCRDITWRIISVHRFGFQGPCAGTSLMLRKPGYVDLTVTTGAMPSVIEMPKIGKEYLHRHLRVFTKEKIILSWCQIDIKRRYSTYRSSGGCHQPCRQARSCGRHHNFVLSGWRWSTAGVLRMVVNSNLIWRSGLFQTTLPCDALVEQSQF